jgi:outer membrane biosynthesis protein TonB
MSAEHVVFFPAPDGTPAFRRLPSLDEVVAFVEHLRNERDVREVSVHTLTEVQLAFRTVYRVEVAGAASEPAAPEPAPESAPETEAVAAPVEEPVAEVPVEEPAEEPVAEASVEPVAEVPAQEPVVEAPAEPVAEVPAQPDGDAAPVGAGDSRSLGFFAS